MLCSELSNTRRREHVTTRFSEMFRVHTREGAQRFMWDCERPPLRWLWCVRHVRCGGQAKGTSWKSMRWCMCGSIWHVAEEA